MRMNVGELIVPATPRPAPKPLANCVLPAPRSPQRQTRSPGWAAAASEAAKRRVASGSVVVIERSRAVEDIGSRVADPARRARAGRRSLDSGLAEALQVCQRDRDRAGALELDPARLEERPILEAAEPGQTRPASLATGP